MSPQEACSCSLDLQHNYGYIYCITFQNGKRYIGQSTRPWKDRWRHHKSPRSGCVALRNAFMKYGWKNTSWRLLGYAKDQKELNDMEVRAISKFGSVSPGGYNISPGGDSYRRHRKEDVEKVFKKFSGKLCKVVSGLRALQEAA